MYMSMEHENYASHKVNLLYKSNDLNKIGTIKNLNSKT